jgi:hypothetical protein
VAVIDFYVRTDDVQSHHSTPASDATSLTRPVRLDWSRYGRDAGQARSDGRIRASNRVVWGGQVCASSRLVNTMSTTSATVSTRLQSR